MGPKRLATQPYSKERFESAKKLFLPGKRSATHRMNDPDHFTKGPYTLRSRSKMTLVKINPTWIDHDNDADYDPSPRRARKRKNGGKCSQPRKKQAKINTPGIILGVSEDENIDASTSVASSHMTFTSVESNEQTMGQLLVDATAFNMPESSRVEGNRVSTELPYSLSDYFPASQPSSEAISDLALPVATYWGLDPRCYSMLDRCQDTPGRQPFRDNKPREE